MNRMMPGLWGTAVSKNWLALAVFASLSVLVVGLFDANIAWAQAGAPIAIRGQVINGTNEGIGVSGVTVTLHQQGPDQHIDVDTTTDGEGRVQFENIIPVPGFGYAVSASYKGAWYGQDLQQVYGGMPPISLTVYEPTEDEAVLEARDISLVITGIDRRSQTVAALEIVTISNASDRTYVPGPEPMKLLRFSLPSGASGLQVQTDLLNADVLQVDKGFGLTAAVPPGDHQIMFAYRFPYYESAVTFTKSFPYGAGQIRVLLPQGNVQLSSTDLRGPERVQVGVNFYTLMTGEILPRGAQVSFRLEGLPQPSFAQRTARSFDTVPWKVVAPVFLGFLVLALTSYALVRRRRLTSIGETPLSVSDGTQEELLQKLRVLTEQFNSGALGETAYHSQRREIAHRLAVLRNDSTSRADSSSRQPVEVALSGSSEQTTNSEPVKDEQ